jgi:ornithine cyclodeaminase/alanine dehydrogenase
LTRTDVSSLLDIRDCIQAIEDAFRQHALGSAVPPAVLSVHLPNGGFHIKAAGVRQACPFFAAKVNGNFSGNPERGLPTIQGVIVLADLTNGMPLAVLDSIEITRLRTAAATAVATKYLARPDASVVTIVGCGIQSQAQLRAVACVRSIAEVYVHDIDAEASRRFISEMEGLLNARVRAASSLRDALRKSDIIITCTTARQPILYQGDLEAGAFVAAVGADNPDKQEIDPKLLASVTVVADVLNQSVSLGDLSHAVAAGLLTPDEVYAELGEIVCGQKPGRRTADEIIVFDSTGMALQDVAASALAYQRAVDRGVGRRIDLSS